jgi:hypothetical protein
MNCPHFTYDLTLKKEKPAPAETGQESQGFPANDKDDEKK